MKKPDFFSRSAAADLEKNNADKVGLKIEIEVISKQSPLPPCQGGVALAAPKKLIYRLKILELLLKELLNYLTNYCGSGGATPP